MEHKKCYITSEPLCKILQYTFPRLQRILNKEHVDEMVEDQKKEYENNQCFSMLQSITVGSLNSEVYVLDGQHRIKAFVELMDMGYPVSDVAIPVVVYVVSSKEELLEYYKKINKHMPIHPFELEDSWEVWGKPFCDGMYDNFANYIKVGSPNKSCRCPHISLHDLKNHLTARANKLRHHKPEDVLNMVLSINQYIKNNVQANLQFTLQSKRRMEECTQKASKFKCQVCYLGVWRRYEWLDIALHYLDNAKKYIESLNLSEFMETRAKIPAVMREKVWKKVQNNICDAGVCFICDNALRYQDMECGHIVAHALGGCDDVDNLMPVCKVCNRDMGIMNLYMYKNMVKNCSHTMDCSE